jgi:hypothetical protein
MLRKKIIAYDGKIIAKISSPASSSFRYIFTFKKYHIEPFLQRNRNLCRFRVVLFFECWKVNCSLERATSVVQILLQAYFLD